MKKLCAGQKILYFIIVLLSAIPAFSNEQEPTRAEIEKQSLKYFNMGSYGSALPGFEKLYSLYPQEIKYNYFLGRCYLHCHSNYPKCIKLLNYAASVNYNADAQFYLFLAYYYNYQFDKAEISLINFTDLAGKRQKMNLRTDYWLNAIELAKTETEKVAGIVDISKEELAYDTIEDAFEKQTNGKVIPKPNRFMLPDDLKAVYQGIMFMPQIIKNGDLLYISGISRKNKTRKDLFNVRLIAGDEYSMPEAITSLNTVDNEEYPYFDKVTNTLYFSSDRQGGLGGYDIYKSKFDEKTLLFELPERLDFPINTPFNDFLYIPDSGSQTAIFLSDRNTSGNKLIAYKILTNNSSAFAFPESSVEMAEISDLAVKVIPVIPPTASENKVSIRPSEELEEYDILLNEALCKQLICDSLNSTIITTKNSLRVEKDPNQRKILFSTLKATEKQLVAERKEADRLFVKAQSLRTGKVFPGVALTENNIETEAVYPDKKTGDLLLYTYKPKKSSENNQYVADPNPKTDKEKGFSTFEILNSPAYNIEKPIPFNEKIPDGLVYRIQLGVYSQIMPDNAFGGLYPISAEREPGNQSIKYFVGFFTTTKEARVALDQVKLSGFQDAFVVPYFQQKKISIHEARELEYGQKKF